MCSMFFQAEDGIRDYKVTGVQTCALPISSVSAGTIASSSGRAITVPKLRRNVRRGSDFLVTNIFGGTPHLKWSATDNRCNQRRQSIVVAGCLSYDRAYNWPIIILQAATQSVSQRL